MSAQWPNAVSSSANLYTAVNFLTTTLSGTINASVTTITLASATNFPTAGGVVIDNEVIFYTGISGNSLTGCVRGSDGTTAASHNGSVPVGAAIIAYHVNALESEVIALETDLHTRIGFGSSVVATPSGTVSAPGLTFSTDTTSGFYLAAAGHIGITIAGTEAIDITTSTVQIDASGVGVMSFTDTAIEPLNAIPILLGNGTVTAPPIAFQNDTEMGFYRIGSHHLGLTNNGTLIMDWTTAALTSALALTITPTTNQLVLGTTNTVTISSTAPSASRTYTLPDVGSAANFVLDQGSNTISGSWTFTAADLKVAPTSGNAEIEINATGNAANSNFLSFTNKSSGAVTQVWHLGQTLVDTDGTMEFRDSTAGTNMLELLPADGGRLRGTEKGTIIAAGFIGETITSTVSTATNFPTSGNYGDLTNISVTAGHWLIYGTMSASLNGATETFTVTGVSATSGNNAPTTGFGRNDSTASLSADNNTSFFGPFEIYLSSTTTYYLKYRANYSAGTPQATGAIMAVRIS